MDATTKPKTRPIASSELQLPLQLWRDLNWEPADAYPATIKRAFDSESSRPPSGFRVVVDSGRAIGVILAWSHAEIGFIGYFAILPEYRGKGHGIALFSDALAFLEQECGCTTIGLDAVLGARAFYERRGFADSGCEVRWWSKAPSSQTEGTGEDDGSRSQTVTAPSDEPPLDNNVVPLNTTLVDKIVDFDVRVTGFRRRATWESLLAEDLGWPGWAIISQDGSAIEAAVFARPTENGRGLGPLWASNDAQALRLLRHANQTFPNTLWTAEVWTDNPRADEVFMAAGWTREDYCMRRMWRGKTPGETNHRGDMQYAVMDSGLG